MQRYSCILIEDDAMAIDMISDYINRRDDLILFGIGSELPASSCIALISGIPLHLYRGPLPAGPIFELSKPISYTNFSRCVEKIVFKLKSEICESPGTV
ncbi:hypothetical protein [Sphingobacterium faecium]|uniref:hypothetical protein n=1 Tax=Sphingobacterium faecium TaxID=34087 RepID=UPI0032081A5D